MDDAAAAPISYDRKLRRFQRELAKVETEFADKLAECRRFIEMRKLAELRNNPPGI